MKANLDDAELKYLTKKYLRKYPCTKLDLPEYLKQHPITLNKPETVKAIAKEILNGSHEESKTIDWINTIIYRNMPR